MKGMTRKEFLDLADKFGFTTRTWDKAREIEMCIKNKEGYNLLLARYYETALYCSFLGRTANEGEAIGWGLFPGYKRNYKDKLVVYDLSSYARCEEFETSEDFVDFLHKQMKVIADFNKEIKKQELIETSKQYEI